MFFFTETARSAARHLLAGRSVRIEGAPGSGKSSTLFAIVELLERRAVNVRQANGIDGLTTNGYLLEQLGLTPRSHGRDGQGHLASIRAAVLSEGETVIVVDDADWGDPLSNHVLNSMIGQVGLLRAVAPGATIKPSWPEVSLSMPSLGFEKVAQLVEEVLGGPAATSLVARVLGKSGGNPELVRAIVESARLSRLIEERDGFWHLARRSLWNDHLRALARWRLRGLEPGELRLLRGLAEEGPRIREECPHPEESEALAGLLLRGVVRSVDVADGCQMVHVWPPLLADMLVREFGAERKPLTQSTDEAIVIGRLFQREADDTSPRRFTAWNSDRTPNAAVEYLRSASGSRFERKHVERVLSETDTQGAPVDDVLRFEIQRAQWLACDDDDLPRALEALESLARRTPAARNGAEAAALLLRAFLDRMPTELGDALDLSPSADSVGIAASTCALLRMFAGDIPGAARLADEHRDSISECDGSGILIPLIRTFAGDAARGHATALATRDRALSIYDRSLFLGASYAATFSSMTAGHVRTTDSDIDGAISTAGASMLSRPLFGATLNIGAMNTALTKGMAPHTSARIRNAEAYAARPGPLYGMGTDITKIVAQKARHPSEFDASISLAIRARRQLGYRSAASASAIFAACVAIGPELVRECAAIASEVAIPLHARAFEAISAIAERDVQLLTKIVSSPAHGDEALVAQIVGGAQRRSERDSDAVFSRALMPLVARLGEAANGDFDTLRIPSGEDVPPLTPREREIAILAGALRNTQIAKRLGISVRTVENHIGNALRKSSARTRYELSGAAEHGEI
ncbi:LuxR C-terminal-related transcriptional regulator [Leifsonia aquatica]|uniref:LuxR C-terminal-related transcriptional regulator n=1 Tax=Leifsonia aquatica TaxID=144185 RepID=UPI0038268D21